MRVVLRRRLFLGASAGDVEFCCWFAGAVGPAGRFLWLWVGCSDDHWFLRVRDIATLPRSQAGVGRFVWWETAPGEAPGLHAVVLRRRALGLVTWWIADGDATLAIGYLVSNEEPDAKPKRAAERRWAELDR